MNQRLRSRVLAIGFLGVIAGASIPLWVPSTAFSQAKPSAAALLHRGAQLLREKRYRAAKRVLLTINEPRLNAAQRKQLNRMLEQSDAGIAGSNPIGRIFQHAQTALLDKHLAYAAQLYTLILKDRSAPPEMRQNASVSLALVRMKQKQAAPQMKKLLHRAIADYRAQHYSAASQALYTIQTTGSDLGWKNNGKVSQYQRLIAQQRLAAVEKIRAAKLASMRKPPRPVVTHHPRRTHPVGPVAVITHKHHHVTTPVPPPPPVTTPRHVAHQPSAVKHHGGTVTGATANPVRHPGTRTVVTGAPPATSLAPHSTQTVTPTPLLPGVQHPVPVPVNVVRQERKARASRLIERADNDVQASRYADAVRLYRRALKIDPTNTAARTGLNYARKVSRGGHINLLQQTQYNITIASERAKVIYNNDMAQSAAALKAQHYNTAVARANDAIASITGSRQYFSHQEYTTLLERARAQVAAAQAQATQVANMRHLQQLRQAAKQQAITERALVRARRRRINALMAQALAFSKRQQYRQAEGVLKQIVTLDPTNNAARFLLRDTRESVQYQEFHDYRQTLTHDMQRLQTDDEEAIIPYHDLIVYPEDWPEISRMRRAEQNNTQSTADRKTRQRLDEPIPQVSASGQPLQSVISFLRTTSNTNIVVNWNALEGAGVEKSTPITLHLNNVPFRTVLTTVLATAGGSSANLGYSVSHGVITISTRGQLNKQTVVRVYDIQDLLVQPPNFNSSPSFNLQTATQNSNTQINGGTGGGQNNNNQSLFQNNTGGQQGQKTKTRRQMVREITRLIESTVSPNSWRRTGGGVGSMRELNGQLVVNQTADNQIKVYNLLQQLREAAALEISIQARFLLVSNNFLNDFGLGWSVSVPAGVLGPNAGAFTANNNTSAIAVPTSTGVPGSLGGSVGGVLGGSSGSAAATASGTSTTSTAAAPSSGALDALDLSGSILSDANVNLLLRATQADKRTVNLTAPRVTLYNGQAGYIVVADQLNFVSNVGQTVASGGINGTGVVGTNLSISTLTTGVVLAVQATASADRRYVVMTLQPSLSTLNGLQSFAVGNAFVQLPNVSLTQVKTTVSVPDGGTLLIGGQKLVGESEIEAGVPVLSKIPFINRLFTNTSYVKDERTLLILVRPRIIIQKEAEFTQFGRNY